MHTPAPEQAKRIQDTLRHLVRAVTAKADADANARALLSFDELETRKQPELAAKLAAILEELEARWPGEELGDRMAEVYFFPLARGAGRDRSDLSQASIDELQIGDRWSQTLCRRHRTPHGAAMAVGRIRHMLLHPFDFECPEILSWSGFHSPTMGNCLEWLASSTEPVALECMEELLAGKWSGPLEIPSAWKERFPPQVTRYSPALFGKDFVERFHGLRIALLRAGRLDYEKYKASVRVLPGSLHGKAWGYYVGNWQHEREELEGAQPPTGAGALRARPRVRDPAEEVLHGYERDHAWELACSFRPEDLPYLSQYHAFGEARLLLRACELIEARPQLEKINRTQYYTPRQSLADLLGRMACLTMLAPTDREDEVVAALTRFSPRTLKIVQAVGGAARLWINRALAEKLGQKDLGPIQTLVASLTSELRGDSGHVTANSPDPSMAVLVQEPIRALLGEYSEQEVKEALDMARRADADRRPAVTLLLALMGWNRAEIERGLGKRLQMSVRAYGLLPLPEGAAGKQECLARYLALRQLARESSQFGPQRRASERAAAAAGLENLARTAGYGDLVRLEWAMEAQLAGSARRDTEVELKDIRARLEMDGEAPRICVTKSGKALKSLPSSLKKSPAFIELQELAKSLKGQGQRCRLALESLCAEGTALEPADLRGLAGLPAGRSLAERLLFRTDDGRIGLYDAAAEALSGLDDAGKRPRIKLGRTLTVVHPLDLYETDTLASWQRTLVERQVVQPFKQAFRELYVLTPVERESRLSSGRFAGHELGARLLGGLLSARGWSSKGTDGLELYKLYPKLKLRADLLLTGYGHYLTEMETVTTDRVELSRYPLPRRTRREEALVPLEEAPPRLLSEVFRDVDLFVSVAQVGDGESRPLSHEQLVKRGELMAAIRGSLGFHNVTLDGHVARVIGKRASYRLHLGSGTIHVDPGNYLCVVPGKAVSTRGIFLPFADGEDPKLGEIVAKLVLLANDDKIKDPSILEQIRPYGPPR